ncbi:glycoside hydrolase family 130 protein [Pontibacter sp. CAU 1760]
MINSKRIILGLALLGLTGTASAQQATQQEAPSKYKEWMLGPFERPNEINPIITPKEKTTFKDPMSGKKVNWEAMATFNPASVVRDGKIHVLYRAEDKLGDMMIGGHTSRLGMATSEDGKAYKRGDKPVLFPDNDSQKQYEWPGGVEDPRIVEKEDGTYVLTYTQWNKDIPRLAVATSKDLKTWEKHGPAFAKAHDGKFRDLDSKSGAILTRKEGDKLIPTKINGKYWMYFGVPHIWMATSDDLVNWDPVLDDRSEIVKVLSPRVGYFDAWLVEAGPPALVTDKGIVVLYNAGNSKALGDTTLADRIYTGGQALYDLNNPMKLLSRSDEPFIKPEMPYEKTGQYVDGTTFMEGLTYFKGKWYLYYGTADSRVAVTVWDPTKAAANTKK